ncbi:hypothetical protein HWV62_24604 [Athelia sp. TMB]|nr:hypothetical protein HWV62_24604 [Athelia sp. TMB]
MEFLNQTYFALRGPTGAPQTAVDTIGRLSDRLSPSTLLADRRAAVLSLKGLSRDHKQDVGDRALPGLVEVLQNDAEIDSDIGKAVLETLNTLCDTDESTSPGGKDLGFKHTDYILANEKATHCLFALLGDTNFYIRYATLQLLSTLLQSRRQVVQAYFLKAPAGPGSVIAVLDDKREITRNEGIVMVQSLISQSPDIQKILAFEGAFEKLFNTIGQEGGVEGGVVAHDALVVVDGLLRFNASNQSYFREIGLPPVLLRILLFAPDLQMHDPAPQEFALQFWDEQKATNTSLVLGILGMLISSKSPNPQESDALTRCLVEIALASNAPTRLKTQALRLLPTNLDFPLPEIVLTPYMPVPESNGEEWDRLEPSSALDALVELPLHGEYNGLNSDKRIKEGLELRTAALSVFENFVRNEDIRQAIVQSMVPSEDPSVVKPNTPLLHALSSPPESPLTPATVTSTHLATQLFGHLLRGSAKAKETARAIKPAPANPETASDAPGQFFVPADGPPPSTVVPVEEDDDDEPQSLIQQLSENLSLAFLSRSRADNSDREAREWDRLVVGYLCLLSQWLWEDPKAVREFLEAGGLGMLVEQTNQTSEVDVVVPGLCAFLLGICYEFNREAGEITRGTIRPLLDRLGVDTLVGRMSRLREDERFKDVGPDSIVLPYPTPANAQIGLKPEGSNEGEIWFDWAFVDFWKSNYYTVQRGFSNDPKSLASSSGANAESAMLIASLREVIQNQSQEIESLQAKVKELSNGNNDNQKQLETEVAALKARLQKSEAKTKEVEKEQEDLLVLLDEVTTKRKHDKERMRLAGLEVSEDEADDDDDDDDDEEDEEDE